MAEYVWDDSFQRKILSLYLREPQQAYSIIEPEYFVSPIHQDISRLAKQLYDKHELKDSGLSRATLLAVTRGYLGKKRHDIWPEYKRVIKKVFHDELPDQNVILDQAIQFARERRFRKALVNAESDINALNYDAAIKRFDNLKGFGAERDLGIEYWANPTDPTRWRTDRQGAIGTFFLPSLDRMMDGGPGAGELAIIIAGGKVGKSTLLGRFAAGALWQGKNVAIATGELSDKKYRKRIDAMVTGHTTSELTKMSYMMDKKRKKLSSEQREMLEETLHAMEKMHSQMKGRLFIKQWPTNKGKVRDIENWVDQLEQDKGVKIDALYVDYIRVFRPNRGSDEHRMNIGEVVLDLRGIAVERGIPVWTANQVNRAALSKERFDPGDIAEDISQFWTLDFLLALCQTKDEVKKGELSEKDRRRGKRPPPEEGRVYLMAARDVGHGGVIPVRIQRDTFRVTENRDAIMTR